MVKKLMCVLSGILILVVPFHLGAEHGHAAHLDQSTYNFYVGSLHSHTSYSDGVGTPARAFAYARDTAKVDFLAVTDHNVCLSGSEYADVRFQANAYTENGVFVAIAGQEWTGLGWDHCNVFEADHVFKASWSDYDSLYRELATSGCTATFNHPCPGCFNDYAYSSIGDIGINAVEVRTDQEQDGYVEILNKGWHVGTDGSQDTHDASWGQGCYWTVALACSLTKADILDATRNHRTYSTRDRDLRLTFRAGGHWMGETFIDVGNVQFSIDVSDPDIGNAFGCIELYENGLPITWTWLHGSSFSWDPVITPPGGENYYFVKVYRFLAARAWSSPIWIDCTTDLPSTPILASRFKGATLTTTLIPTLAWHPSNNADTYTLEYSTSADLLSDPSMVTIPGITDTSYTPTHDLGDRVSYYWRVLAASDSGSSEYSGTDSLSLDVGLFTSASEIRLTGYSTSDANPAIVQTSGDIWLAWASDRNGDGELYYKISSDLGETWSYETRLTSQAGDDGCPAIAEDQDGRIWVVWQSAREGGYEIYYKTYDGTSWSQDVSLTQNTFADIEPSITQASDGLIWVIWSSNRKDGNYEIYYVTFDGDSWSSVKRLTNNESQDYYPEVVESDDGELWVVWCTDRDGRSEVYYKIFNGISWSDDMRLTYSAGDKQSPSITQTSDGEVWATYAKSGNVFYKRYDGADWSEESMLFGKWYSNQWSSVTQASDGRMWVAYCSTRGGNQDIFAQRSNSDVTAAAETPRDVDAEPGLTMARVFPNPFDAKANIEFALPEDRSIELAIYGIAGQKVRTLMEGRLSAGRHEIAWNGTDSWGRPVSPGIYFCRLEAGKQVSSRKIVVVK
jgi:hypothetical protein